MVNQSRQPTPAGAEGTSVARASAAIAATQGVAGGPSAIRGFRLQALYALHRLLSQDESRRGELLQPEGAEDLAVFLGSNLTEACQVKAKGAALALSDLEPDKKDGFFPRTIALVHAHPSITIRLVSFGPVGPELSAAVAGSGRERDRVLAKLGVAGIKRRQSRCIGPWWIPVSWFRLWQRSTGAPCLATRERTAGEPFRLRE